MEESSIIEKLLLFGLGRQEAVIYVCLLKNGELTGYEVAKLTGISRSNVYNALASLVERGAAYVCEGSANKYVAVSIEEFCDNRIRYLQEQEQFLLLHAPKRQLPTEGYITIEGYEHIMDKIHHMILGAEQRIYFTGNEAFLAKWELEIKEVLAKEVKVVLLSEKLPENLSKEKIIYYKRLPGTEAWDPGQEQIRLIIDSAYVLTGDIMGTSADTCLYSAQKNFVNVFKEAMSNEIKLIEIHNTK
ncbi:MAG: TrmB family transcriptional regulator [Lachnospiraceae bacterium]|nr:TrmB family transcriptional regulator [Lachnospiraceae bacterium]